MTRGWNRLRSFFRKADLDRDFSSELSAHIDLLTDELVAGGMSPEEARRQAGIKLGGVESAKELHRDTRSLPWMETLSQDLRYTARTFRRDPAFVLFATLIIGLGIAGTTIVFNVINALLVRPLPFKNPSTLTYVMNGDGQTGLSEATVMVGYMLDLRKQSQSFSDVAGYFAFYNIGDNKLLGQGEPERLTGVPVSQNFFPVLGVQPVLGRNFSDEEAKFNGPGAVMLSHHIWEKRFASDPRIIGQKLRINDDVSTVVGVLPASFDFGAVFHPGTRIDLFFAFPLTEETNRWGNTMALVARLNPGTTVDQAEAEGRVLSKRFAEQHPKWNNLEFHVSDLQKHVSGQLRPALLVLAAAVFVVMLIVCANLSNLLLARSASRQKEMAIRAAMGAGRGRLVRQMLTESVALSATGAFFGLVLALLGTRLLSHLDSLSIPMLSDVRIDGSALGFTILVALGTGLIFGLAPALHVPLATVHDALKENSRGSTDGKDHAWIRRTLVVSEIAFACVLLVGAGLLIRSFLHVLDVNLGFHPESAATIRVDPSSNKYKMQEQKNGYYDEALRLVKDIPGVAAAGLTDVLPLGTNRTWGICVKGLSACKDPKDFHDSFVRIVTDGYFSAMGIPIKEGRDFTPSDTKGTEGVVVINENFVREAMPGQDAVGKFIFVDSLKIARRVIGVVGDVRHLALEKTGGNEFYIPMRQTQDYGSVGLVVRSNIPPQSLAGDVRNALLPIEPNLATNEFRTLQQIVDKSTSPRRFVVIVLASFAGFALILASLGIYALISYSVSQRTQEIGIRMALGASAGDLQKQILFQTLALTGVGMALGLFASWLLARYVSSLLFGVTAGDPLTFGAMIAVLTLVASLAGFLPARRASQIEPMTALRTA
jgi:predicted permease